MRQLQTLRLQDMDEEGGRDGLLLTPEQVDTIRSLPSLETLTLEPFVLRSLLWRLLATPHQLSWTSVPVSAKLGRINDAEASLIGSLPNLTSCPNMRFAGSNLEWLRSIRALRTLALDFSACTAEAAALLPGLKACSHLTSLTLEHANALGTADWIAMLSSMHALSSLHIGWLNDGAKLECLSAVSSLAHSLESLELEECAGMVGSHLCPLQSLRNLRSLRITHCFVSAPPELRALRAPLMPILTVWHHLIQS